MTAPTWSVVTAAAAKDRISRQGLAKPFRDLVGHALRREETVLWCSGAWARPKKVPVSDLAKVALVVIDGPLITKAGLRLRYDDLVGGGHVARNDAAFLFLGEVQAQDIFNVPDVLALFPRGVAVDRIASFEGADGHVLIAHHLHAPVVVSGISGGGATVAKDTDVRIGAFAREIFGVPKKIAGAYEELEELLPFLADRMNQDHIWALLEQYKGKKLPKSFVLPQPVRPIRSPGGHAGRSVGTPKRASKPTSTDNADSRGRRRSPKKVLADVTRSFENPSCGTYCRVVVKGSAYVLHRGDIGGKATRPRAYRFATREEAHAAVRSLIQTLRRKPWKEVEA